MSAEKNFHWKMDDICYSKLEKKWYISTCTIKKIYLYTDFKDISQAHMLRKHKSNTSEMYSECLHNYVNTCIRQQSIDVVNLLKVYCRCMVCQHSRFINWLSWNLFKKDNIVDVVTAFLNAIQRYGKTILLIQKFPFVNVI